MITEDEAFLFRGKPKLTLKAGYLHINRRGT